MNSHGLNGPLLASFNNGLVFTFYPGHTLTDTEMRDKRIIGSVFRNSNAKGTVCCKSERQICVEQHEHQFIHTLHVDAINV